MTHVYMHTGMVGKVTNEMENRLLARCQGWTMGKAWYVPVVA